MTYVYIYIYICCFQKTEGQKKCWVVLQFFFLCGISGDIQNHSGRI